MLRVKGSNSETTNVEVREMKLGDIGIIFTGSFKGHKVLRTYGQLVSLDNPSLTWYDPSKITFPVALYPKGTQIILEVM